jgi:hypothetical protein
MGGKIEHKADECWYASSIVICFEVRERIDQHTWRNRIIEIDYMASDMKRSGARMAQGPT